MTVLRPLIAFTIFLLGSQANSQSEVADLFMRCTDEICEQKQNLNSTSVQQVFHLVNAVGEANAYQPEFYQKPAHGTLTESSELQEKMIAEAKRKADKWLGLDPSAAGN